MTGAQEWYEEQLKNRGWRYRFWYRFYKTRLSIGEWFRRKK